MAAERIGKFEARDRELGVEKLPEFEVSTNYSSAARMSEGREPRHDSDLARRTDGFSESAVVLPSGERRDGSRMPVTCVFGLPRDGRGSLWLLTPSGLDADCLSADEFGLDVAHFGAELELGPDFDGDGIRDVVVSALSIDGERGCIYVVSIAERMLLFAREDLERRCVAFCAVPDQDGDDREDLAILSPLPDVHLSVVSTGGGRVLREFELERRYPNRPWRPDHRLRVLPRADLDANPLLLVSTPATDAAELSVVDVRTGRALWNTSCGRFRRGDYSHWCGLSSAVVTEDLDGDGTSDVLAAGYSGSNTSDGYTNVVSWSTGHYSVLSGSTGEVLRRVDDIRFHEGGDGQVFVTDYEDIDGDGFREHIVGATLVFSRDLIVFSGRTGEALHQIVLGPLPFEYSNDIQSHVDWDGDGRDDLVLHDTDVWQETMEQQLMVLSMASHTLLHSVRPCGLELAIAAREARPNVAEDE